MSTVLYEAISVGAMTVVFGNVTACVLDLFILSPNLKLKLPFNGGTDKLYDMGIVLFLTGVFSHLLYELLGVNKWYCREGFACKR